MEGAEFKFKLNKSMNGYYEENDNEDYMESIKGITGKKDLSSAKEKQIDLYSLAASRAMIRLRKIKNLGQGAAAVESNLSPSYLSNVERGNHAISVNKLMTFSEGINANPEEICDLLCEEIAKCEKAPKNKSRITHK